jgi:terminase large subunit-like protein
LPSRPRGGGTSTSQGHPYTIFRRALERGNLLGAEATAKELPRLGLEDALELTLLAVRKDPRRHPQVAARWLLRYLERSAELVERRLAESLIFPVQPSSRHMRDALQTFYRVVSEGTLRHRGDPVIAAHLANCGVERGHRDEIRRVRKIDERKPIDAVPAMALAVWRATQAETADIPLSVFV